VLRRALLTFLLVLSVATGLAIYTRPGATPTGSIRANCARSPVPSRSTFTHFKLANNEDFRNDRDVPSDWDIYHGPAQSSTSFLSSSHVVIGKVGAHSRALYIKGYHDPAHPGYPMTTGGLQDHFGAVSGGFSVCLDFNTLSRRSDGPKVKIVVISWPSDNDWPQHGEIDALEGKIGDWDTAIVIGKSSQYATANHDPMAGSYDLVNGSAWARMVHPSIDTATSHVITCLWDPVDGIQVYLDKTLVRRASPSESPGDWYPGAYGVVGRNVAVQTEYLGGTPNGTKIDARIYWRTHYTFLG